ncbi:hypothetical protein [Spirillospora sp. NPDC047279]|uniref:hypothetical protein n=1 Tax=Spirillospora sp. NPDC047279 TaxID=3155478 RepID=UPI00340151FD
MRKFVAVWGVVAMTAGMFAVSAVSASAADGGDITCQGGNGQVQFNPGVTFKKGTTQVQANGDLGTCTSASQPKITGGVWRFVGSGTGACPGPFAVGTGKMQISWSDGTTSVLPGTSVRAEAFTWSLDGAVSQGSFTGQTSHLSGRSTTSATDMGAQCITSGLNTYSGTIESFAIGAG